MNLPFTFDPQAFAHIDVEARAAEYAASGPIKHVVIDHLLREPHATFLKHCFPSPDHPVWLDWRKRSGHQYGKQGPGNSDNFHTLYPLLRMALNEFLTTPFLTFLETVTGVQRLIPDPHFTGGGLHQSVEGGFLDVHTDFNDYSRLGLYRRLNVLIYLNSNWTPANGGELELWSDKPAHGHLIKSIPPLFNRTVIFHTDKKSFHGVPNPWHCPLGRTRKSIALYYYTADRVDGDEYTVETDFQGVVFREVV